MSKVRRPRVQREQPDTPTFQAVEQADSAALIPQGDASLLATNTGVRLACTMAAMLSPFALFLCWAERENRTIRRFAVQSAALFAVHILIGAVLCVASTAVGKIPYLGFIASLLGWLLYIATALVVIFLRIKLMERAWHGRRFDLPLLERLIHRYY